MLLHGIPAGKSRAPSAFPAELVRGQRRCAGPALRGAGWLGSIPSLPLAVGRAGSRGALGSRPLWPRAGPHPACPQGPGLSVTRNVAIARGRDNRCHRICALGVLPFPILRSCWQRSGKPFSTCLALSPSSTSLGAFKLKARRAGGEKPSPPCAHPGLAQGLPLSGAGGRHVPFPVRCSSAPLLRCCSCTHGRGVWLCTGD